MSKLSLDSITIARKGHAYPAQSTNEPRDQVAFLPSNQGTKRRPWHGEGSNNPLKVNYEITEGLAKKIATLKSWDKIDTIKAFVNATLEKEVDRLIAQAEKEGY
jgi:hypothetical protein